MVRMQIFRNYIYVIFRNYIYVVYLIYHTLRTYICVFRQTSLDRKIRPFTDSMMLPFPEFGFAIIIVIHQQETETPF